MKQDFSFLILCHDHDVGALKNTVNSIQLVFNDKPYFALVGENARPVDISDLTKYCPVVKGGKTITSLMDAGITSSKTGWNFILNAGSRIKKGIMNKYQYFATNPRDVLFPVINRKYIFHEASINGIYINKLAIKEVGEFGDAGEDIKTVKLLWAMDAIAKGYQFKAIVGGKLF